MNDELKSLKKKSSPVGIGYGDWDKLWDKIKKELFDFEQLKHPYDEFYTVDEKYMATREAYWDDFNNELRYGYTIRMWRGKYTTRTINLINPKTNKPHTMKFKRYEEIMHFTSDERYELTENLIECRIAVREILTKEYKGE